MFETYYVPGRALTFAQFIMLFQKPQTQQVRAGALHTFCNLHSEILLLYLIYDSVLLLLIHLKLLKFKFQSVMAF